MLLNWTAALFLTLAFFVFDASVVGSEDALSTSKAQDPLIEDAWSGTPDIINTPLIIDPEPNSSLSPTDLTYISKVMGIAISYPDSAIVESPEIGILKIYPDTTTQYDNPHLPVDPSLTFELVNLPPQTTFEMFIEQQLIIWELDPNITILSQVSDISIGQLYGVTVSIYDLGDLDVRYLHLSDNQMLVIINPVMPSDYTQFDQLVSDVLNSLEKRGT